MSRHLTRRGAALASALLALLVFLPTLPHRFAYDDAITIVENPLVTEHRFAEILVAPYHAGPSQTVPTGLWRPLTTASFALNHALHGLEPAGYHAVNILLHAIATGLLALVAFEGVARLGSREIAGRAALAAGLLFAVHPVHVEAVANVSGRAEPLSAALFLGAILAYLRLRREDGAPSVGGISLAAALAFLSCLAKEHAVTFFLVAAAYEGLRTRSLRKAMRVKALLAIPAVAYVALRFAVLGSLTLGPGAVTFLENPVVGQNFGVRLLTVVAIAGKAAGLLFLPWKLTPDYGYAHTAPVVSPLAFEFVAGAIALLGVGYAVLRLHRRRPEIVFGLALALLPWILVSNLFVTIGTIFGERLLYLPSAGFAIVIGAGFATMRSRRVAGWVGVAVILLASAKTVSWSLAWKDDRALFAAAERTAPESVRVLANLGAELAVRGDLEGAERRLRRAAEIAPTLAAVRINLAGVYLKQGRLDEAESEALEAVRLAPGDRVAAAQLEAVRRARGGG